MIYDIFQINNEEDILDIRINTLKDIVDVFIVLEAPYTYSGIKKPLHFMNKYKAKYEGIRFINLIADMPTKHHTTNKVARKTNEHVQRNCFVHNITFNRDDILLVGDIDEIPNPDTLQSILGLNEPMRLNQKFYYFYMNYRCKTDWVTGTVVLRGKDFSNFAKVRTEKTKWLIDNGGWHYSYMEDPVYKIGNLVEVEFDKEEFKTDEWISYVVENSIDIFNRDIEWYVEDKPDPPPYVYWNYKKFKKYFYTPTIMFDLGEH